MSIALLTLIILGLSALGYLLGRQRALAAVEGDARKLHSLPSYYGASVFLFTALPAFLTLLVWLIAQPLLIERSVAGMITPADIPAGTTLSLVMSDVQRIAVGTEQLVADGMSETELAALQADPAGLRSALGRLGVSVAETTTPNVLEAAKAYRASASLGHFGMIVAALALAVAGLLISAFRVTPELRARNIVESFIRVLLIGASTVAILTTLGIVFSLVFESWHFFQLYPAKDFFFSLTWNPKFGGGSSLGVWPLVWGTLYVSFVALVIAVPLGILSAIYLSEYASPTVRSVAKPLLEILAGIPSIVYGLFALVTVGPLLRDWLAMPLGLGASSSSVATAGLVMGIMLIPYVSSLSDDIINSVPQSLRDGSYAIGATPSETVRQVVLPAALPGIVGAVLLAASRAIGETMIVVMGAGAAAKLSMNPFEAMTTVTVKIVSQLTGDTEFASPETLVAFALGLTLFVFTLGLNILALFIVRKYREQYE
ncbi:phosphate ABC transporter permease subunit PstC [Xinfangfangia sp. CPCC 101601]|uniref:Phosphate transport system permease protein n=1 Tax=Pseudogemmobacter lacusdianii TaxID=3069608 RepID=A0ABU0VXR0_9RHOB|nr:phosphate ABC transporter permease subunit PstC [Xinfangfangia sp. CPCC 101601]MDQ2066544.1 phosphate ABC transporter permease subunit PstC [Xinfangfangia sp. CPCC 101601]